MKANNRQIGYKVKIIVNPEKVDLQYEYHNPNVRRKWVLKEQLQNYITLSLRAGLTFKKKEDTFRILDEKIMKSGQTGNFQFDPFCFSVQIYLCNVMGDKFDSYKLDQNKTIGFTYPNDLPEQFEKDQITDDTSIDQLMDNIGKVLQIEKDRLDNYKDNFKTNYIKKVSDLKSWKEEQISKANSFPLRVLKEVYKAANKIDYYSEKMFTSKKLKNNIEIMKCVKLGNSHKVLRYCLFKNNPQQLEQVSYLNFENIEKSLDIINKQLKLEESIIQNLKRFLYQFALPHGQKYVYSRGAIFNGPPGTGKTMITELLMFLCGFSLISQGISASDFSKSYVGQAGRMINQLFSRAHCCSYLACSIAIDEIEGAFPNRNDASEKNKGEATSQFLSVIEGNKNIENLFILSSTNHINKIDEAILRRLGDRFDLTRLNFSDRKQILKDAFETEATLVGRYLQQNQKQKEMILNLTMNFTGAAFKKLLSQFEGAIQNKILLQKVNVNDVKLKDEEVENMITKIASDYKIIFGSKTLPELVHSNKKQKKYLNKQFLQSIESHFMFITIEQQSISLAYMNRRIDQNGKLIRELEELKFNTYQKLRKQDKESMKSFIDFLNKEMSRTFDSQVKIFESVQKLNQAFKQAIADSKEGSKIFLITDQLYRLQNQRKKDMINILEQIQCFNKDKENVFVFYVSINVNPATFFGLTKSEKNYSGRIMVEIDKAPRIVFQLKPTFPKENLVYIQNHFSGDEQPKPDDMIPNIMQFFNKNELSNIFMIDNYFLEAKSAFTSEKEIETIRAVIEEAQKLSNVGLIINFDSVLVSSKTGGKSKDDKDKEEEFEIDNKTLYRSLINICRTFSCKNERVQRWVALFVKSSILIKKIRSDIYWPEMPEEAIQKKKEEELNRKRVCCRCGQQYTEKQNQEQRKCSQHPGILINTLLAKTSTMDFETALRQNQMQELRNNAEENNDEKGKKEFPNYIYSCCFANVKETENVCSKMHLFRHIEEHEKGKLSDELHLYQDSNFPKWKNNFQRIEGQLLKTNKPVYTGYQPTTTYTANKPSSSKRFGGYS